ncbi:hypothetical protein [Psychromonas sp. L1A2]|uniref:hypothetical protein n=1 Tax=Psychromonas sp. L1A2 TaxID=2686356 RepID=UPI00135BC838|nr:hypothetical protein [Psychromonas sp. L1A2]
MKAEVRLAYIARITTEIGEAITGNNFERLGYIISCSYLKNVELFHRGTNLAGAPVKSVVDTFSQCGTIVAEYSTDATYFKKLDKIEKDTKHSLEHYPETLKTLFLLNNRVCPPDEQKKITKYVDTIKQEEHVDLIIWDGRKIAEYIVDELLFDEGITNLISTFLPCVQNIVNESLLNFTLPKKDSNYQVRGELEEELIGMLLDGESVVIAGFGGLGKSSICNYLANTLKGEFDIVLWIDGTEIHSLNELGSSDVLRNGHSQNVLGLLKTRKCLLVLDNLGAAVLVKDLNEICSNNSVILASRRDCSEPDYLPLPLLNKSLAKKILEFGASVQCPEDILDKVYGIVGGDPLIYALMNKNIINKRCDWEDIKSDCEVVSEYKDNKNQKLTERLLGHLIVPLQTQLSFLKACQSKLIDLTFAKSVLKSIGIIELEDSTILTKSSHNLLKVHDIIFEAINNLDSIVPMDIDNKFSLLLSKQNSEDLDAFLRTSYRHLDLIGLLLKKTGKNIYLYAYINASPLNKINYSLIPKPEELLNLIEVDKTEENELMVFLIIQLVETEYLSIKCDDYHAAESTLKDKLPIFETLLKMFSGMEIESRVRHHYAKTLKRLKDPSAESEFFKLCQLPIPMREAQLQLARIYAKSKREEEAKSLILEIMESWEADNSASIPIMLSSFEVVSWKSMSSYRDLFNSKYADLISNIIKESMAFGYDYAYLAFSSFASDWSYNFPEKFAETFEYLPLPTFDSVSDDDVKNSMGDLYREAGKIGRLRDTENYKDLLNLAIEFYESTIKKSNYYMLRLAEARHLIGDNESAEEICNELVQAEYRSPQKYYWLAKAQLQDKPDIALKSVELALDGLNGQFRTASLELKSDILRSLEDSDYLTPLVEAIELCSSEKYQTQLKSKYFELTGKK